MTTQTPIARLVALRHTPSQVKGPFFLADAPLRSNAITAGDKGDVIELKGEVLSVDGKSIAGAVVHFWLADTKGAYDNQDADGNPVPIARRDYRNRVRVTTNRRGSYRLQCLRPGNYPLVGEAVDVRPEHIHALVEAPGYKTLVTQLYFQDDGYNEHDIPREEFFVPELVLHLQPALPRVGTLQHGVFNFVLQAS